MKWLFSMWSRQPYTIPLIWLNITMSTYTGLVNWIKGEWPFTSALLVMIEFVVLYGVYKVRG
ncbi:hypothetical protein [Alicyclobacillus dauci]|uniref:Uncharacterized protein n=1 Tax=Alicyclobacillus dauci TaxID=1475485 RepID=A0ABY6YXQ4_9BACL|nr:hypothetical protein [Alicyclobacillus dauci]WAH35023.1 hypothetical protein NZD86_11855 [Alicyclobacillus dauci]